MGNCIEWEIIVWVLVIQIVKVLFYSSSDLNIFLQQNKVKP